MYDRPIRIIHCGGDKQKCKSIGQCCKSFLSNTLFDRHSNYTGFKQNLGWPYTKLVDSFIVGPTLQLRLNLHLGLKPFYWIYIQLISQFGIEWICNENCGVFANLQCKTRMYAGLLLYGLVGNWLSDQMVLMKSSDMQILNGIDYLSALRVTCTFTLEHNPTSELFSM